MSTRKTLIHFHIPLTAGSTLDMIIRRQFPIDAFLHLNVTNNSHCIDDFMSLPEERRAAIKYLDGHMPFGLHEYFPDSATYVTMLRNPVDRVISEYYHILRNTEHPLHQIVNAQNINLPDFVRHYARSETLPGITDHQTRYISGTQWRELLPASEPDSDNILQTAKANFQRHFSLVGLTERFDESLILLKRAYGWRMKDILYLRRNTGRNRPLTRSIDPDTIKLIQSHNELDIQLYQFGVEMFEERLLKEGFLFKLELQAFRMLNKIYGLIASSKTLKKLYFGSGSYLLVRKIRKTFATQMYEKQS